MVWENSRANHGALLVLLAIADCADDLGRAYPSVRHIGRKSRLSERATQTAIRELQDLGEVRIEPNAGPMGCNVYWVLPIPRRICAPAETAPPQKRAVAPAESAPKPSVEPSVKTIPPLPPSHPELEALANAGAATGEREEWKAKRLPRSNEAVRLARMFDRALTQSWAEAEIAAFRNLCPFDPVELQLVERFYVANWHLADNPQRCRKSLLALLQNWSIELDKAKAWCRSHPEKKKPKTAAELPAEPPGFRAWFQQTYPKARADHPWAELPTDIPEKYFASIKGDGNTTFKDAVP